MRVRLLIAITAATAVALSGPFVGEINNALQGAFPGQHLRIVFAAVVAPAIAGLVLGMARIRENRVFRFGALAFAVLIALSYVAVMQPLATEQFHLTEYGLLTFLFYRVWRSSGDVTALVLPVIATFVTGMADEWFQWFIPSRVGELRDVLLNGVGIACGLLFAAGLNPPSGAGMPVEPRSVRALGLGAGVLIACTAVFLQCVHLGFEIVDPAIGTFRSRFAPATLLDLSADRMVRWQTGLPPAPLISFEDHYLSEARFHIQERNDVLEDGDAAAAWHENQILEAYFRPALDLAMASSRWPPEQRTEVETRAAADPRAYVSDAYPLPIYAWSRLAFWSAVVVLLGAVGAGTFVRRHTLSSAATV